MMSTAILMAMGAEQSSKQAAAHDVENFDGPTFAQTLDERVGLSMATSGEDFGKNSKVALLSGVASGDTEPITKALVDSPDLMAGGKAKVSAGPLKQAQIESKGSDYAKAAPLHSATMLEAKVQKNTEESQVAEAIGNMGEDQTETAAVTQVAPAANFQTEDAVSLDQTAGNQTELRQIQTPLIEEKTSATSNMHEAAPEKKAATKTQAEDAVQPVVTAKNREVTVSSMFDKTKPVHEAGAQVGVQAANSTPAHAAASVLPINIAASAVSTAPAANPNVAQSVNGSKSEVCSGAPSLSGGSPYRVATDDGSGSRNALHDAKTSVSDRETTPARPGDSAVAAKADAKEERSQVIAANATDSDTKTQTTGDASVAMVHALASGSEAAAAPAAALAAGLTKPFGEGSTSTAGSSNGLREQDGSSGVTRSLEPMPRTLLASPTALEVGIPDGTHGWLKVRAEMADGGVVNASVSAASPASQEMLHRELPSLTAYLQSEKVAVHTVVVHPAVSVGPASAGFSAGSESGGSGQTPRHGNEGGQQQSSVKAVAEDVTNHRRLHEVNKDGMSPLASYEGGGGWLSIRA